MNPQATPLADPGDSDSQIKVSPYLFHFQILLLIPTLIRAYYTIYNVRITSESNPVKSSCQSAMCELWEPCQNPQDFPTWGGGAGDSH